MATPVVLGDFEQLVILGVFQAGAEAYGVSIWKEIATRTARDVSMGAVYKTLERLETKGLLTSRVGPPTSERGGRSKRIYGVTTAGRRAVRSFVSALISMTAGLEQALEP